MYFRLMGCFIEYPSILFSLGTKEGGAGALDACVCTAVRDWKII